MNLQFCTLSSGCSGQRLLGGQECRLLNITRATAQNVSPFLCVTFMLTTREDAGNVRNVNRVSQDTCSGNKTVGHEIQ